MDVLESLHYGRFGTMETLRGKLALTLHSNPFADSLPTEENQWAASSLLAKILLVSSTEGHLDKQRLIELLPGQSLHPVLESLEQRQILRFVHNRLHIPGGVRAYIYQHLRKRVPPPPSPLGIDDVDQQDEGERKIVASPLSQEETTVLLAAYESLQANGRFTIACEMLCQLVAEHRVAHPRTPEVEALMGRAITKSVGENHDVYTYSLSQVARMDLWYPIMPKTLAIIWEELSIGDDSGQLRVGFETWFSLASETGQISPSVLHMSESAKGKFMTCALHAVLGEESYTAGEGELVRLKWEFENCFSPDFSHRLTPPPAHNLRALYDWWCDPVFSYRRDPYPIEFDLLVGAIVQNDQVHHLEAVKALLQASLEKPALAELVSQPLEYSSRGQLPAVIAHPASSTFGLALLARIEIYPPSHNTWDHLERESYVSERKMDLWQDGVHLFFSALHQMNAEERVQAIAEALWIAARQDYRSIYLDPIRQNAAKSRLRLLQELLIDSAEALGLAENLPEMIVKLKELHMQERKVNSESGGMPSRLFGLLFWLLESTLTKTSMSPAIRGPVVEMILDLYGQEMKRAKTPEGRTVNWWDDGIDTLELPWEQVALCLPVQNQSKLLVPGSAALEARLATAGEELVEPSDHEQRYLVKAWLHKLRHHLRLLLRIHRGLRESLNFRNLTLTEHEVSTFKTTVEIRVETITKAAIKNLDLEGEFSLFSQDWERILLAERAPDPAISAELVDALAYFAPESRDRIVECWIADDGDPRSLMTLIEGKFPEQLRKQAEAKLAGLDLDTLIEKRMRVPELMKLCEQANLAGQLEIVTKVLARGDGLPEKKLQSVGWPSFAYQMRLQLAYRRKSLAELDSVPVPPTESGIRAGEISPWDSKSFYRALILLETEPEKSKVLFDELVQKHPNIESLVQNRLASAISIASRLTDPEERRRAFGMALADWEQAAAVLTSVLKDKASMVWNKLVCLDGAQLDDQFDTLWLQLDDVARARLELVKIAADNALRRGLPERATALREHAKRFHTIARGQVSEEFKTWSEETRRTIELGRPTESLSHEESSNLNGVRAIYQKLSMLNSRTVIDVLEGPGVRIDEFLLKHLVASCAELLLRVPLLRQLRSEDEYNDFLVSYLRMRLHFLRWDTQDQSRGGDSSSGHHAGERDGVLRDAHGSEIAIVESLRLKTLDAEYIRVHLKKATKNYNPSGIQCTFIVVYYHGDDLESFWTRYFEFVRTEPLESWKPQHATNDGPVPNATAMRSGLVEYLLNGAPLYMHHVMLHLPTPVLDSVAPIGVVPSKKKSSKRAAGRKSVPAKRGVKGKKK